MKKPTALLIPCPWSGDEHDPIPRSYWWWFKLYKTVRIVRHWVRLHDWEIMLSGFYKCDWCGKLDGKVVKMRIDKW